MTLHDAIWTDSGRLGGKPCFRGTRVPIELLVLNLRNGTSVDDFLEDYPPVTREQAEAVLDSANEELLRPQRWRRHRATCRAGRRGAASRPPRPPR